MYTQPRFRKFHSAAEWLAISEVGTLPANRVRSKKVDSDVITYVMLGNKVKQEDVLADLQFHKKSYPVPAGFVEQDTVFDIFPVDWLSHAVIAINRLPQNPDKSPWYQIWNLRCVTPHFSLAGISCARKCFAKSNFVC